MAENDNTKRKMTNLDTFIQHSRPQPRPLATSQEIRDRASTFVANIYPITSPEDARSVIRHIKHVVHADKPASHEIAAWRCMVLKHGCTGLSGPSDFELNTGSMDDGEKWAGDKILKMMQQHAVIDAVVIVSRWYGGTLLGSARFTHIETCTSEVCREFKRSERLRECISTLSTLDAILAELRSEYNNTLRPKVRYPEALVPQVVTQSPASKDYSHIDIITGERLIKARENSIKAVKSLIAKRSG